MEKYGVKNFCTNKLTRSLFKHKLKNKDKSVKLFFLSSFILNETDKSLLTFYVNLKSYYIDLFSFKKKKILEKSNLTPESVFLTKLFIEKLKNNLIQTNSKISLILDNFRPKAILLASESAEFPNETFANFRLGNRILRNSIVATYLKNYRETVTSHKIQAGGIMTTLETTVTKNGLRKDYVLVPLEGGGSYESIIKTLNICQALIACFMML